MSGTLLLRQTPFLLIRVRFAETSSAAVEHVANSPGGFFDRHGFWRTGWWDGAEWHEGYWDGTTWVQAWWDGFMWYDGPRPGSTQ